MRRRCETSSAKRRSPLRVVSPWPVRCSPSGDSEGAALQVRKGWASDELTERTESDVLDAFRSLLRGEDHRARMDKRIGAKDMSGALARRASARQRRPRDRESLYRRQRQREEGRKLAQRCARVGAPGSWLYALPRQLADAPEQAHRRCARNHRCAAGDHGGAGHRRVVAHTTPAGAQAARPRPVPGRLRRRAYRGACRPTTTTAPNSISCRAGSRCATSTTRRRRASTFAHIDEGSADPIVLARANYWRGRAAETLGDSAAMWNAYEAAARYTTAYYGQLARAKLGVDAITLRAAPRAEPTHDATLTDELVHAADMLYEVGERDTVVSFFAALGEQSNDAQLLAALGELAGKRNDARSMLEIGKAALARGLAVDPYAFPTIGIPQHTPIAPDIGRSMTYAVARTESAFNPRDRSSANAVGLMQVTPEAGRDTAKRFGVSYDWDRMVNDPRLQHPDGRGRARARCCPSTRAATSWCSPATTPAAAGCANGSRPTAIRATPMSIRSTGSNAFRSPRRATTCSASWRTCCLSRPLPGDRNGGIEACAASRGHQCQRAGSQRRAVGSGATLSGPAGPVFISARHA